MLILWDGVDGCIYILSDTAIFLAVNKHYENLKPNSALVNPSMLPSLGTHRSASAAEIKLRKQVRYIVSFRVKNK